MDNNSSYLVFLRVYNLNCCCCLNKIAWISLYIYSSATCRAVVDGKGCAFKEEDILYLKFQKKILDLIRKKN